MWRGEFFEALGKSKTAEKDGTWQNRKRNDRKCFKDVQGCDIEFKMKVNSELVTKKQETKFSYCL